MNEGEKTGPGKGSGGADESMVARAFDSHAQVMYNLALRVLRSPEEAADALNEVFTSAWREFSPGFWSGGEVEEVLVSRTRDLVTGRRRARSAGRDDRPVDLEKLAESLTMRVRAGEGVPPSLLRLEPALSGVIERCGSVTAALLSHVYFGGLTISETAAMVSVTPSECLSRLSGCLNMIATRTGGERPAEGRCGFLVDRAAHALGALEPAGSPEFLEHFSEGCPDCASAVQRFTYAAAKLPFLLPDMTMPSGLKEQILFSLRLALVVAGDAADTPASVPAAGSGRAGSAGEVQRHGPRPKARDRIARLRRRHGVLLPAGLGALALTLACGLAMQTSMLRETIDRQSYLIESIQTKNARLLVEYDRLAGVSGFFESKGVVAMLAGDSAYPGLTGKLVWDTAGSRAMLQILNFPADLEGSELEVSAVRDGFRERVAGFIPQAGDSGNVLYRFFPVAPGHDPLPSEFSVAAVQEEGDGGRVYRKIMAGTMPVRASRPGVSGPE